LPAWHWLDILDDVHFFDGIRRMQDCRNSAKWSATYRRRTPEEAGPLSS
jgi:hypothetical protein